jgi:hypothetical protein
MLSAKDEAKFVFERGCEQLLDRFTGDVFNFGPTLAIAFAAAVTG